ncbi:MAG: hypothetical protein V4663_09045 [Bacteroidota bacterium]
MLKKTILITFITSFINLTFTLAQDSLITTIAKNNVSDFSITPNGFSGTGWNKIIARVNKSNNVLIGEDHFTNEIPFFVTKIASQIKFDNFFCEIDPFTAKLFQTKLKTLATESLKKYVSAYSNTFSFYAFEPEFDLLKQLVKSDVKIYGTDQILLVADRLICSELSQTTKNPRAKALYELISNQSKKHFEDFLKDQKNSFYMYTTEYERNIEELSKLKLSAQELKIINALKLTAKIYKSGDHHLRIQLMKNQLMEVYNDWHNKKNLFKFGANHVLKGQSLLEIYDIGNLVNNISDSQYKESLHLMVIGKSGLQASPFKGFPSEKIDENTGMLKSLKPFFQLVDGKTWKCFDLSPIKKAVDNGKVKITDTTLLRVINGFDLLVVIPEVTASEFVK